MTIFKGALVTSARVALYREPTLLAAKCQPQLPTSYFSLEMHSKAATDVVELPMPGALPRWGATALVCAAAIARELVGPGDWSLSTCWGTRRIWPQTACETAGCDTPPARNAFYPPAACQLTQLCCLGRAARSLGLEGYDQRMTPRYQGPCPLTRCAAAKSRGTGLSLARENTPAWVF